MSLRFPDLTSEIEADRGSNPLWIDAQGWTPRGLALLELLESSANEGLQPDDYHLGVLSTWTDEIPPTEQPLLEHLMTDAFLGYGLDSWGAGLDTSAFPAKMSIPDRRALFLRELKDILLEGKATDAHLGLDRLGQLSHQYRRLRQALRDARTQWSKTPWSPLPGGPTLHPGDPDIRIPQLRTVLLQNGDLAPAKHYPFWISAFSYTPDLVAGVKTFQERHGLNPDGIIGSKTLAALNISPQERIEKIRLNMERLRWQPSSSSPRCLVVNIPDFSLILRQEDTTVFKTRVVVGRPQRPTPVLSGLLSSVVVNPFWNVPQKLARRDLLPRIQKDPSFLANHHFKVYESWTPGAQELDPLAIDWSAIDSWNLTYKFRQSPGPENALGQVKFLFDNPFSVFIHDTNHKERFASTSRPFSSGCIRVQNPVGLADLLLDHGELQPLLEANTNQRMPLPTPVPVRLEYLTCWVDDEGILQFRDDVYGYDTLLADAVAHRVPERPLTQVALSKDANPHQDRTGPVSTWTKPDP